MAPDAARSILSRPTARLLLAVAALVLVLLTPPRLWPVYLVQAALLVVVAWRVGADFRRVAVRLAAVGVYLLVLAAGIPASRGLASGWDLMAGAWSKSILSVFIVLLLTETTRGADLLAGLRRLGVPRVLVGTLGLTVRYLRLLADESKRMQRAKAARTFRPDRRLDWRVGSNFIGMMFARSLERAERVHQAMLARGWAGEPLVLDEKP